LTTAGKRVTPILYAHDDVPAGPVPEPTDHFVLAKIGRPCADCATRSGMQKKGDPEVAL
jgi:hypothetical protein